MEILLFLWFSGLDHSSRRINADNFTAGKKARDHRRIRSITASQIQNPFSTIQTQLRDESGSPFSLMSRALFIFFPVKFVCHVFPA